MPGYAVNVSISDSVGAARENIDVAARFDAAPQAADRLHLHARRLGFQKSEQLPSDLVRVCKVVAARVALAFFKRFQNERLLLRSHSFDGANLTANGRPLEIIERADVKLTVQGSDCLGPDSLQVQQVEDRWRELREEFAMECGPAGVDDFPDARRQIFADAWNLAQTVHVERDHGVWMIGDGIGRVLVRPDLERVFAFYLEQIGDFGEDARDRSVIQP